MKKLDILIVSVPVLDLQYPPSSPAIIKACAKSAGFSARTLDLNILLRNLCKDKEEFYQVQYQFENVGKHKLNDDDDIIDIFFTDSKEKIKNWIDVSIEKIRAADPKWLGISVFSYKSHKGALLLCNEVKKQLPDIKIVLGGRGASSYPLGPDHNAFIDKIKTFYGGYKPAIFGNVLLDLQLVDNLILGDGEQSIIDLLSGSDEVKMEGAVQNIDLETLPFVDFDDYNLQDYDYVNEPTIPITGSKGCVRKCTFCDIPVLWPKFKFRTGEHIAKEMIHLYNKHKVSKFYMSDSLVNGSMKAFKDFIKTLAEHNSQHPNEKIKWVGQYITRPVSKELNDEYYDLLKSSGGEGLTIGVESGSDAVRAHMKKQFKTVDIDTELEQFDKRGIVCVLLFFSCYPTETYEDFVETVKMFIRYQKYCASGTVYKITLGIPYTHHQHTPLWNMQEEIGLSIKKGSDILWSLNTNSTLTFRERIRRRLILQEVATALKLPMSRNTPELNQLIDSMNLHRKDIDEYFVNETKVVTYNDDYNLIGGKILMPPEIQRLVAKQIRRYPKYIDNILEKHSNTNDDILFDNSSYTRLKELIL